MKKLKSAHRFQIADQAKENLHDPDAEARPGWCQRWVKQALLHAHVSAALAVDGATSARDAFGKYTDMGMVMPEHTIAQTGDLVYRVRPNDGRFGHVGIYIGGGQVAENSSVHYGGQVRDGRGIRDISAFVGYRVVRLWGS